MKALGIDIGGSGIKGAVVDTRTGVLVSERHRIKTPKPSTPAAVAETVARLRDQFAWTGPIGCGMPGPIVRGQILTAANIDRSWIGADVRKVFRDGTGTPVTVVNDADAAGSAEVAFGAGKGIAGTVLVLTLGTGIGSALFTDGRLVPNTEFGQITLRGKPAEQRASARVRKVRDLSWAAWARRLNEYLGMLEGYLYPDLIVLGGGVSRKAPRFIPKLRTLAPVVPARFCNEAGIIGAALAAVHSQAH
jgi:polyphosphate glucokinase